jgi:transcriptional regulator with XRE-family HTH domain
MGEQHRRVREFLGFSQDQVAGLAGVSQGAVSRLEAGRGVNTPAVVLMRIGFVYVRALKEVDSEVLSDEMRRFLVLEQRLSPRIGGVGFDMPSLTSDPLIEEIVRLYRRLSDRQRPLLLRVVRAVASVLASGADTPDAEE